MEYLAKYSIPFPANKRVISVALLFSRRKMPQLNVAPADIEAGATHDAPTPTVQANTATTIRLNRRHRRRRRRRRPSVTASSETTTEGSFRFSETENDGSRSYDECSFSTETEAISVISDTEQRRCSRRGASSCTFSEDEGNGKEVDLEKGELEMKVYRKRERRRECRICHLSVAGNGRNSGDRRIIELGCCCKGDLGSAHKQCAETWFKIKGNTTCEICGAPATNIAVEQPIEINSTLVTTPSIAPIMAAPSVLPETQQSFWHGRRFMNFLLACMIFAFIISWLFHFNILPFAMNP